MNREVKNRIKGKNRKIEHLFLLIATTLCLDVAIRILVIIKIT